MKRTYFTGQGVILVDERREWLNRDRVWEKVYSERSLAQIPWHSDKPDQVFIELIESEKIRPCYVLDVGCGAGTDTIYLASKGANVTAIDISQEVITTARARAEKAGVKVDFIAGDFLEVQFDDESFDFVNDRGCFHVINPLRREDFAAKVSRVLKGQGFYYLRCRSDKQVEWQGGPPTISQDVIYRTFSKFFDGGEIRDVRWGGKGFWCYVCLMSKRVVSPVQVLPSERGVVVID